MKKALVALAAVLMIMGIQQAYDLDSLFVSKSVASEVEESTAEARERLPTEEEELMICDDLACGGDLFSF